jgi:hypothetical protein
MQRDLLSMPPALTKITSGAASGSVVSGDPYRAQHWRPTRMPLAPTSSKTVVSRSSSNVERLRMMTVENALPDCGRHQLQWRRPAATYPGENRYGSEKITIVALPVPPKKPDTTPEVVATYCFASIA